MKKILIEFIVIFTILYLSFKYNIDIKNNINNISMLFITNILPSMFIFIFISNYIKYNICITNKFVKFISLALSFSPSNSVLASTDKELLYSSNINPLFAYSILSLTLSKKESVIIILTNLIFNYILLYKNIKVSNINNKHKSITELINITTNIIINIFGIIIFFNIIISILNNIINSKYLVLLEITNGFNIIKTLSNKTFLYSFLYSFNGVAILMQIKSISNKNIYLLILYKFIISLIISILISIWC